jgi:anti-sigma factor RsiW
MIAANDQENGPGAAELDLMAYLDGELEEARLAEVEAKLASDPLYRAQLRAMTALGDFVREDASRIYAKSDVDGVVEKVMEHLPRASALPPSSAMAPMSSVATRRKKNSVIWIAFGTVAAAAAGLFFYVQGHSGQGNVAVDTPKTVQAPAETVAVKTPALSTSKGTPNMPIPEVKTPGPAVQDLEVGEGATVVYTTSETGEASPVVWVTAKK